MYQFSFHCGLFKGHFPSHRTFYFVLPCIPHLSSKSLLKLKNEALSLFSQNIFQNILKIIIWKLSYIYNANKSCNINYKYMFNSLLLEPKKFFKSKVLGQLDLFDYFTEIHSNTLKLVVYSALIFQITFKHWFHFASLIAFFNRKLKYIK